MPETAIPDATTALILDKITALERRMDGIQRELAFTGNIGKGTGHQIPYSEVLFLDGSRPTVAVSGRAALPPLDNVTCIRNLTAAEATQYLVGHGVDPIPQEAQECKIRVARVVGCLIQL
ncbi:hypothetical protein B0H13DRAFT_2656036 [Mycena leptocephala]|nr:hypothetical protein B0H13DRAFT_2656036 [Mycena leptocephala]